MEKKFELVMEDSIVVEGRTLYRIRALKNVVESDDGTYAVKKGTLGGYVQKEENLSHEGDCWVFDNAKVFDDVRVQDNAFITDESMVFGNAVVKDKAITCNQSKIYGFAIVKDSSITMDRSEVFGHAVMENYSSIGDDAKLYGSAKMDDNSDLRGFAEAYEYARLRGLCLVGGDARIYGHAVINGQARITDHASVKDNGIVSGRSMICGHATVSKNGKVFGVGRIDFNIAGDNDVAVYSDPINKNHYITASTKEDWFTGIKYSGNQKDFLDEANKRSHGEFEKYFMITNLHLDLYDLREK